MVRSEKTAEVFASYGWRISNAGAFLGERDRLGDGESGLQKVEADWLATSYCF